MYETLLFSTLADYITEIGMLFLLILLVCILPHNSILYSSLFLKAVTCICGGSRQLRYS